MRKRISKMEKHLLEYKKETIEYYIENDTHFILDIDKKYIYCHFHIDQRIYMDKNGFMQCNECIKQLGARS